jgi:hypothetical protein
MSAMDVSASGRALFVGLLMPRTLGHRSGEAGDQVVVAGEPDTGVMLCIA